VAGLTFARPLSEEDAEVLAPIDKGYAERFRLEPVLTRGSLTFYLRTGHAFVAVRGGEAVGFVLAQAVWNGVRPTVFVNRLATLDLGDTEARAALVEAVTKSAYDAAVYDLQVQLPAGDEGGRRALETKDYRPLGQVLYGRVLGSRGQKPTQKPA